MPPTFLQNAIAPQAKAGRKQLLSYLMGAVLTLLTCSDCNDKVSSSAMTCVHCGNVLQRHQPGVLGTLIRAFYLIFCAVIVGIGSMAILTTGKDERPSDMLMIPVIIFGIWFAVSVAIAALLYVTRHGRTVRVDGAVESSADEVGNGRANQNGWASQIR